MIEKNIYGAHLKLRQAQRGDGVVLMSLIRQLAVYEYLEEFVTAPEQMEQVLFDTRGAYSIIAEYDDVPVGYMIYFYNVSTFKAKCGLYIEDIFVLKEYRGRGIGKALLLCARDIAVENKCGRLEWSCLTWNKPSLRFYSAMGANVLEDWRILRVDEENFDKFGNTENS